MEEFRIKTKQEQLALYIKRAIEINELSFANIENEIAKEFVLEDLLEFSLNSSDNETISNFILELENGVLDIVFENSFKQISQWEISLGKAEYVAMLIGYKHKLINSISNFDISYFIELLDVHIARGIAKLGCMSENEVNLNDALGLFFIYDKNKALNIFSNFIRKYYSENNYELSAIYVLTNIESFFGKLNLDYIPRISNNRYKSLDIYMKKDEYVTLEQIEQVCRQKEYFRREYPLQNINPIHLLNDRNYEDKQIVYKMLNEYFKMLLKNKIFFKDVNIVEIFLSNFSERFPKYSFIELVEAQRIMRNFVKEKNGKELILAPFISLYEGENIKFIINKISILLPEYLGDDFYKKTTVEQHFKKPYRRPIKLVKAIQECMKFLNTIDL